MSLHDCKSLHIARAILHFAVAKSRGGVLSFEEIYSEYEDMLRRFALGLSRNEDTANDLVAETFMRAYKNMELLSVMPDYKQKSWLFTVLKNYFFDMKRKTKKESVTDYDIDCAVYENYDSDIDAQILLSYLPEDLKEIFVMKFVLGLNSSEISEEKNLPAGTVRYKLHQGITILRRKIK